MERKKNLLYAFKSDREKGKENRKTEKLYLKSTRAEDATESRGGEGRVGGNFLTVTTLYGGGIETEAD